MYELESTDHYDRVVETIKNAAERNDPSSPRHVAQNVIATTDVVGDELAMRHSAQPYAEERLKPTEVLMYSRFGYGPERPLSESEQERMENESLREQAVRALTHDLNEVGYKQD